MEANDCEANKEALAHGNPRTKIKNQGKKWSMRAVGLTPSQLTFA